MRPLEPFLAGYLAAVYAAIALFFLRFWRMTGDRLFAWFATAFALLVVQRVALAFFGTEQSTAVELYLIRLLAFVLILIAIVEKNRTGSSPSR